MTTPAPAPAPAPAPKNATVSNTPLVRKASDSTDDAIWFDPSCCTLDDPLTRAEDRYVFVHSEDDVPRIMLDGVPVVVAPIPTNAEPLKSTCQTFAPLPGISLGAGAVISCQGKACILTGTLQEAP